MFFSAAAFAIAGGSYNFTARGGGSLEIEGYVTGVGRLSGGAIIAEATLRGWLQCGSGGYKSGSHSRVPVQVNGTGSATATANGRVSFYIYISDDALGLGHMGKSSCPHHYGAAPEFLHDELVLTFTAVESNGHRSIPAPPATFHCRAPKPAAVVEYRCQQVG